MQFLKKLKKIIKKKKKDYKMGEAFESIMRGLREIKVHRVKELSIKTNCKKCIYFKTNSCSDWKYVKPRPKRCSYFTKEKDVLTRIVKSFLYRG